MIICNCGNEISYTKENLELSTNTLIKGRIKCDKCKEEYLLKYTLKKVINMEDI